MEILRGRKPSMPSGRSFFQRQSLTKAMDFNEITPNGAIWKSSASFKTWSYYSLLTEVCALESFPLESRRQDFYIIAAGVRMSGSVVRTWVPNHREMCALLPSLADGHL